jgi:hypothetical protein
MLLTAGDTKYKAHFHYSKYDGKRETHCTLHVAPCAAAMRPCGTKPAGTGLTICSHLDEFKRATGRKIALGRAMSGLRLPRDVRMTLWADYLAQTHVRVRV